MIFKFMRPLNRLRSKFAMCVGRLDSLLLGQLTGSKLVNCATVAMVWWPNDLAIRLSGVRSAAWTVSGVDRKRTALHSIELIRLERRSLSLFRI